MLRLTTILCFLGAIALAACAPSIPAESTNEPAYAWDFSLSTLEGEQYTLSELRGNWVILNFWATWCVPCVTEMPVLQEIADQYSDQLLVLGINNRETPQEVDSFRQTHNIRFPLLMNPDDATLTNYMVMNLPQTIIVDPQGEIVWRQFGPVELENFSKDLQNLMADS